MQARVRNVSSILETHYPTYIAESWDNVGLQIGSYDGLVSKIMVTLEVDAAVLSEAVIQQVDLIITHHPLFFKSIKTINYDQPQGDLIKTMIQHNINLFAAHTNLDAGSHGLNQYLAEKLELQDIALLDCSNQNLAYSPGRIGQLNESVSLREFCVYVKQKLQIDTLRVVGDWQNRVRKIALVSGAGTSFINTAHAQGCDLLVTGDLKYHEAKDAQALGLNIIDAGHQQMERLMAPLVANMLRESAIKLGYELEIIAHIGSDCIISI